MYLTKPCPRCNNKTLNQPVKSGNRLTCLCDTCGKRTGYKIIDHADGSKTYELFFVGGNATTKTVMRSHRLPPDLAGLSTESLVAYARKGKQLSDTMQYIQ